MWRKWSEEEIAALKRMAAEGASIHNMSVVLGRGETAIRVFLKKHRIRRRGLHTLWTERELKAFREDWKNSELSKANLMKKYRRSWTALRQKARKLGLGHRPVSDYFFTRQELKAAVGISDSKLSSWVRQGLPVHRSRSNENYGALFDLDEVLCFLQARQEEFDGSLVDESCFYHMPKWLRDKCRRDCISQNWHYKKPWSAEENGRLKHLFASGLSDAALAEALGRSVPAVKARRFQLGLRRRPNKSGG